LSNAIEPFHDILSSKLRAVLSGGCEPGTSPSCHDEPQGVVDRQGEETRGLSESAPELARSQRL